MLRIHILRQVIRALPQQPIQVHDLCPAQSSGLCTSAYHIRALLQRGVNKSRGSIKLAELVLRDPQIKLPSVTGTDGAQKGCRKGTAFLADRTLRGFRCDLSFLRSLRR